MEGARLPANKLREAFSAFLQAVRGLRSSVLTRCPKLFSAIFAPGFYQLPGNEWLWVPDLTDTWGCQHVQFWSVRDEKLRWVSGVCCPSPLTSRSLYKLPNWGFLSKVLSLGTSAKQSPFPRHRHMAPSALSLEMPRGIPGAGLAPVASAAGSPQGALDKF